MSEEKEFGYYTKDEDGVELLVKSNHGQDKGKYLKHAKKLDRPIGISIESHIFDSYKFTTFALNVNEAKAMIRELNRMIDHLEENE